MILFSLLFIRRGEFSRCSFPLIISAKTPLPLFFSPSSLLVQILQFFLDSQSQFRIPYFGKMDLSELIILFILRINKVFIVGYAGYEEQAATLFDNILVILEGFHIRQSGHIGITITRFTVFEKTPSARLKLSGKPESEQSGQEPEIGSVYAARSALNFFEKKWAKFCNSIIDFEKLTCRKKGLQCFIDICYFFNDCSLYYQHCYAESVHISICKNPSNHSEHVKWNIKMVSERIQGKADWFKEAQKDYANRMFKRAVVKYKHPVSVFFKKDCGCPLFAKKNK